MATPETEIPAAPTAPRPVDPLRGSPGSPASSHVRVLLTRPGSARCEELPAEQISDVIRSPDALVWVDIRDPQEADFAMLREEFRFHDLALEDATKQRQRPKVDEYPDYYFIVMYAPLPTGAGEEAQTMELDLFVGRNYLVSLHAGEVPALREALDRWERTDPELRQHVGFLLHTVIDAVIDDYFPIVDDIEDRLDEVEMAMFQGKRGADAERLLSVKRSLFTFRKAIYPMREVFNAFLRREGLFFSAETYPYFQDVYDHVLRLLDTIDIQRDMATGVLDAQLAFVSNRLNETMKTLTLVAICVAIAGAVFGAWGMNFTHVPLDYLGLAGFGLVSFGTVVLAILALIWARRKGLW